jgi:hypothetical protein
VASLQRQRRQCSGDELQSVFQEEENEDGEDEIGKDKKWPVHAPESVPSLSVGQSRLPEEDSVRSTKKQECNRRHRSPYNELAHMSCIAYHHGVLHYLSQSLSLAFLCCLSILQM